jgi:AraC-like DNA-binding protein
MPSSPPAPPRLSIAGARAAYVGPGLGLAPHTNAVAVVAAGLEARFQLTLAGNPPLSASIALVPPRTRHHLVSAGPMAFVYLDAASDDHNHLRAADLHARHAALVAAAADPGADVDGLCDALGVPPRRPIDPRIRRVLDALETQPDDARPLAAWAALEGLSASRFQALFTQELGLAFRRYRTWRRMAAVVRALAAGGTLTEAAFAAGFASSAHLSATFRGMFGLAPSGLKGMRLRAGPPVGLDV